MFLKCMFAPNLTIWKIYKSLFVNTYIVAFCKFSLGPISLQHSSSIKYSILFCFFFLSFLCLFLFFSTFDFLCLLVRLMQSLSRSKVIFARSKNQQKKKKKKIVNPQQHILRPTFNLVASTIFRWVVVRSNSNMFKIQSNSISNCLTCLAFMSKHQFRANFCPSLKKNTGKNCLDLSLRVSWL